MQKRKGDTRSNGSTGVYWKPVFNVLEENFEVILVNARHVKNVPGHKTDKKDSAWLSELLFIKILEDANIKLSSVLTNVDGATGTKILSVLIEGVTNPKLLSRHYHGKIKASKSKTEMIEGLNGKLTAHHQFMLKTIKRSMSDKEALIEEFDCQIEIATKDYQVYIEHLQTIPRVGKDSAIGIISEIGGDMSLFPNQNHLSSWSGMSPGNNESSGKKSSKNSTRQ